MRIFILCMFITIMLASLGCGKVTTSSSNDKLIYGGSVTGNSNFLAARAVLSQNCFQCHDWAAYSEADFTGQALVIQNASVNSRLYQKIKGNDSGVTGNMPPSGSLTDTDVLKIKTWIDTM
jgi:uncharacterized membrane protein